MCQEHRTAENPAFRRRRIINRLDSVTVSTTGVNSNVCSTMEHPFRHKEKGWVRTEELLPGDFLKKRNGEYAQITYTRQRKEEKEQWVYNLEVEGLHSYYVAGEKLLVHNGEGVCPSGEVEIKSGSYSGGLAKVDSPDALAVKIGGESRVKFANDPNGREFDVVSSEYIA